MGQSSLMIQTLRSFQCQILRQAFIPVTANVEVAASVEAVEAAPPGFEDILAATGLRCVAIIAGGLESVEWVHRVLVEQVLSEFNRQIIGCDVRNSIDAVKVAEDEYRSMLSQKRTSRSCRSD